MNMHNRRYATSLGVILWTVLTALALVTGSSRQPQAQETGSGLNLVYLESNNSAADSNSVLGFSNDGLGNLTPLPGSPYLTGGDGVSGGGPEFDADDEVIVNPEGTLLFAVNGHTNTVAAFSINADGSLTAAPGSPFASGGQDPASLALKDNYLGTGISRLVAVNKNSDHSQTGGKANYTTFNVKANGVMTMNSGSTYNLPAGASPAQAVMSPNLLNKFFTAQLDNKTVASYSFNRQGLISQISVFTPPGSSPQVVAVAAHPTTAVLYAALPNQNQIAVYSYDAFGKLTYLTEAANQGTAPCWLAMNAAGTRLYSAETPSSSLSVYDTTIASNPTQLQHLILDGGGASPTSMALDPTGNFLYVVGRPGRLHVLSVASDGTLTDLNTVDLGLPAGDIPLGVAVVMK
ncbi:MAG TPA: beta-propeller fold lactonase family protein [Terriglobia bacterium]|nr:beta-propeller fold lactonase family protein [Terriglobia bacterium]